MVFAVLAYKVSELIAALARTNRLTRFSDSF